ncbi:MAG TPA: IS5 family transposase [Candidatus Nanoarchaeia archaeon]|nr:IS5 family transposase [Candidatus Nanoarchaeia archaeon]
MDSLTDFALKEKYSRVQNLRSELEEVKRLVDWNSFLALFPKRDYRVGRRGYHTIIKLKLLFLQGWYGISDEELEYQVNDRLSFQQFLDFPKSTPDYSTVWRFREYLTEFDLAEKIWAELQRQIETHNLHVKEGVIQDARFIHADPGKTNSGMSDRGREAKTSRSKDGTWTKKNGKSIFGFKFHSKMQRGSKIITEFAVTTAKTYDGHIDLADENDVMYRDRGYSGSKTKAKGDATMKKGKLSVIEKLRNKRIAKKRAEGEHPFGTMERKFKAGRTKLTTLPRVYIQQMFVSIVYNVSRLRFLLST